MYFKCIFITYQLPLCRFYMYSIQPFVVQEAFHIKMSQRSLEFSSWIFIFIFRIVYLYIGETLSNLGDISTYWNILLETNWNILLETCVQMRKTHQMFKHLSNNINCRFISKKNLLLTSGSPRRK